MPPESEADVHSDSGTCSPACTPSVAGKTIEVTGACTGGSGCVAGTTVTITVASTAIKNKGWIKTPLASTDSFTITTYEHSAGTNYKIDELGASLVATPALTTNTFTLGSLSRAAAESTSADEVNSRVDVSVDFTLVNNPIPAGGYLTFTFPQELFYKISTASVEAYVGATKLTVGGSTQYTSTNQIQLVSNVVACPAECAAASTVTLKFSWLKNPPYVLSPKTAGTVTAASFTS